ncbi:hypothetical protein [Limnospira indica]|uniref:Uncharacterized protein n=1 Tax=Limnospira indica PCC 8005 TaxID=376219 RepID=A0A9P1KJD7_9CYAN|nr:hypothetical protein [Limnospira indica]CDM97478.1 conserved protein of unknown function [Limnospira indica PCC 8005]
MANVGRLTQQTYIMMARQRRITKLSDKRPERVRIELQPNWDVYQLQPDRKNPDYKLLMAGSESALALQLSQLGWMEKMIDHLLNASDLKFDDWFDAWAAGYPELRYRSNPKLPNLSTNYPARNLRNSDGDTIPRWRGDASSRPAYIEWHPSDRKTSKEVGLHRTIEYFPDRSENKSVVLTGNDKELIRQILQIHYEGSGSSEKSDSTVSTGISYRGAPKVVLYFLERIEDVEKGYRQLEARVGFRLVGKTENPNGVGDLLTKANIRSLAQRIFQHFLQPQQFRFRKGRESVSYRDKSSGLESFVFATSTAEGVNLYQRICEVMEIEFDNSKVFTSTNQNPAQAFPITSPEVTILGNKIKPPRRRPVGYVYFREAKLFLEMLNEPILLCDYNGHLYRNPD